MTVKHPPPPLEVTPILAPISYIIHPVQYIHIRMIPKSWQFIINKIVCQASHKSKMPKIGIILMFAGQMLESE